MNESESIYTDFAAKVSFLEFIQDEFRNADFPIKELEKEISGLVAKKRWNITDLSDFVKENPRSFLIFQEIFQLLRFTNAQLIHFVFDITKLNSLNLDAIFEYLVLNLKYDIEFRKIYIKLMKSDLAYEDFIGKIEKYDKKCLIAVFKSAVAKYVDKLVKNFSILEKRITTSEFGDLSIRFCNYLLNNLKLNETLAAVNVGNFLKYKRIPLDTKALHGNYLKIKIINILESNGYININNILNEKGVQTVKHDLHNQIDPSLIKNNKIFCTERYIDGIIKPRDNKPKKFDLLIFSKSTPKYLFEMNFYSTEGTKIGINQNEYIDLNNYIRQNYKDYEFYWITDGNYWLTTQGKARFLNLLKYFDKILNINIFAEYLNNFK